MNQPAAVEDTRPEVLVIAGFLGSGKTTLLQKILQQKGDLSDTAVIVNEFGQVGIDGLLLKREGLHMVELVNGCICCSLNAEISAVLSELSARDDIRLIVIEATGLAEPGALISLMTGGELVDKVRFRGVISVLDARLWDLRRNLGPFFTNQLRDAVVVILNKIDLVGEADTRRIREEMAQELPGRRILETSYGEVNLRESIRSAPAGRREDPFPGIAGTDGSLASEYSQVLFVESRPFEGACFEAFLRELAPNVVRAKGVVKYPEQIRILNYSFGEVSWEPVTGEKETRLEFIGKVINKQELVKRLRECVRVG